jgi:nickel transport protein
LIARALAASILLLASASPTAAHELLYHVGTADNAAVVQLYYEGHEPFAYEAYRLYRGDEELPFQLGRTDALGRVVFLPGDAERWRLVTHSEDGHGVDTGIVVAASGAPSLERGALLERFPRLVIGIAVLLGLFGLYQLFLRRRRG